jgi:GT2 family glycosyltransferase
MTRARDELTSIVVVAADSGRALRESVDRALASTAAIELILVDNASQDDEPMRARERHAEDPRFAVIANDANHGFGPACNEGAAAASGDSLLFLNPDCFIEPDTIARLRVILARDPALGLLGVNVRTPEGVQARANRRRDPTFRRVLMTLCGLARFETRWPALAGVEMPPIPESQDDVERVDAVSGACMFVRRDAFERVGGFDEQYFLHVEDLDLCRRIREAGYAVAIAHAVHVVHAQGSSSAHRPLFVAMHKRRGMWRYFTKFDACARNPLARALVWFGLWLRFAATALAYRFSALAAKARGRISRQ